MHGPLHVSEDMNIAYESGCWGLAFLVSVAVPYVYIIFATNQSGTRFSYVF